MRVKNLVNASEGVCTAPPIFTVEFQSGDTVECNIGFLICGTMMYGDLHGNIRKFSDERIIEQLQAVQWTDALIYAAARLLKWVGKQNLWESIPDATGPTTSKPFYQFLIDLADESAVEIDYAGGAVNGRFEVTDRYTGETRWCPINFRESFDPEREDVGYVLALLKKSGGKFLQTYIA